MSQQTLRGYGFRLANDVPASGLLVTSNLGLAVCTVKGNGHWGAPELRQMFILV